MTTPISPPSIPARHRPHTTRVGRLALGGYGIGVLAFLLIPIATVVVMSFTSSSYLKFPPPGFSLQWYERYFGSADWLAATWLSVRIAVATMLLSTLLGVPAAFGLMRLGHWSARGIYGLLISPIVVPQIVTAVACYSMFVKLRLIGTPLAIVVGHTILATPFVVVTVASALARTDETLEWAAMSLGLGRLRAVAKATVPLIRPAIIAGAIFAFIASFDEIVVALFLAGTTMPTLPKKMWDEVVMQIDPTLSAVSTILIVLSVGVVLVAHWQSRT